tara:strand:- start:603 stop:1448 length:846 start_codon:yes stop_codon:yes gene_type:complete
MARGVLKWDDFGLILDRLAPIASQIRVVVLYHGGEPLLNKNFARMVVAVKSLGIPFVKTVTNGMLLDDRRCVELIESGLDALEVSLDGDSAEMNNAVRRNSDFQMIVDGIHRLISHRRSRGLKHPQVHVSTTRFLDPSGPAELPATPSPHLLHAFENIEDELEGYKATYAMRWPYMHVDPDTYDVFIADERASGTCDYVEETMTIRWNGDIVACCYDLTSKLVMGNIRENTIEEIWHGEEYKTLRENLNSGRYPDPCSNCNAIRSPAYLIPKANQLSIEAA